ncbi:MAG: hypothetical protein ACYS0D_13925 [Planctomycetota bacterium]
MRLEVGEAARDRLALLLGHLVAGGVVLCALVGTLLDRLGRRSLGSGVRLAGIGFGRGTEG